MNNSRVLFVVFILGLGIFLRIFFLGEIPSGLHYSEATIGLRAQNLIDFGKDEYGRSMPLIFSGRDGLEMPIPTYLSIPFIAIAKTNPFFLRLSAVFAGIFAILGSIVLTKRLFPTVKFLDLTVGFFIAINPWGMWLSRIISPEMFAFAFLVWGWYFLLNNKTFFIGVILLFLSIASSINSLLFLFIFLPLIYIFGKNSKDYLVSFGVVLLFAVFILLTPFGFKSLLDNQFNLFSNAILLDHINLLRGQDLMQGNWGFFSVFLYNKAYYIVKIIQNFLSYFNPQFLFAAGDGNLLHGLVNFGPVLIVFLPLFLFGLYLILKDLKLENKTVLYWLVAAIMPGLFLLESPNTTSFLFALYPISLITALGIVNLNKKLIPALIILVVLNLSVVVFDVVTKGELRAKKVFDPIIIDLGKYIKSKEGNTFKLSKREGVIKRVWLSDGLDPNPGPALAYLWHTPYTRTNLSQFKNNFYKGWISSIGDVDIGNEELIRNNPLRYDLVILSAGKTDIFACHHKIDEIGVGDNKYLIFEGCSEDEIKK